MKKKKFKILFVLKSNQKKKNHALSMHQNNKCARKKN